MALADVYDALISKRVYKPAFTHEDSVRIILEGGGTHFDPDVVQAFRAVQQDFRLIAARFSDEDEATPAA
jgi:putative two-component system response regulator